MQTLDGGNSFIWDMNFGQTGGSGNLIANTSGTGASSSNATVGADLTNPLGFINCVSGTTSSGRAKLGMGNAASVRLGGGSWLIKGVVQVPQLSVVGDEFRSYFGFYDGTTGDGTDCVQFLYDRSTYGDVWVVDSANNSTHTTTATSIAIVAGQVYVLTIEVNADATLARYYIDGVLVGTSSTNIPSAAGRETQFSFGGRKTAGTTTIGFMSASRVIIAHNPTNRRFSV